MRDILIHRYDDVELDVIWDAIQDLPNLRVAVEAILTNLPLDDEAARMNVTMLNPFTRHCSERMQLKGGSLQYIDPTLYSP